ncbi:hypothetical protein [Streptomyces humidus]
MGPVEAFDDGSAALAADGTLTASTTNSETKSIVKLPLDRGHLETGR